MNLKLIILTLILIDFIRSVTVMSTCLPTDYKGVISRDQILSLSFAMDAQSEPERTMYLVGGYAKTLTTRKT